MKLSAPGKTFLAGEYAVLERGQPALVAALDRALHAEWQPAARTRLVHAPSRAALNAGDDGFTLGEAPPQLRFAAAGARLAARLCAEEGLAPRGLELVYLDDFDDGGVKLGLGGSAAATVLAVRAVCAAQGRPLAGPETLSLSLAAHWAESGSGSGGDVAASALGGLLLVRARHAWHSPDEVLAAPVRRLLAETPLDAERIEVPADLRLLLAFMGRAADSRKLVAQARAFAQASPQRWAAHADALGGAALALASALQDAALQDAAVSDPRDTIPVGWGTGAPLGRESGAAAPAADARARALAAVQRAGAALSAFGAEANIGIVTPELARACAQAASAGAAAKPSGAGGGDCAVVMAFGDEARDRAEHALRDFRTFRASVSP